MSLIDLKTENVVKRYGAMYAVDHLSFEVKKGSFFSILGPSGCGKTTLLRMIAGFLSPDSGNLLIGGQSMAAVPPNRRPVNMVFQHLALFPMMTVGENVAYGLRLQGVKDKRILDEVVETSLKGAALWNEVKDRLHDNAFGLSGGQQQRLVIARAIAIEPEVLLLDEPASALDPISTLKIEELIYELKDKYTIVIVTHNMQQAARVSDYTAFMYMGDLIEFDATNKMFTNPSQQQTEDYITGRFG